MSNEKWPDEEGYPNLHTRNILKWCEEVEEVTIDDTETLPRMVKETDTKTLIGVFAHYDAILSDHERLGPDEVPFSRWDHEIRFSVHQELRKRGVGIVPAELREMVDALLTQKPEGTLEN